MARSRNSGHRNVGSLDTAPLNLAALRPVTRQLSSSKIREETCTRLRRGRVPTACTGAAFSRRPLARIVPRGHAPRIENPGTGPRTCANGLMSTSEASISPVGSVGPGRSPLGTRTQRRELSRAAMRRNLTEMQPPPRTCANGSMSTSEASVSPAGSVGPERSPLGTRTQRRESSRAATRRELRAQVLGRARALTV